MSGFCSGICNEISRCCYDFAHAPFTKKNLLIAGGVLVGLIILIIIIVVASGNSKGGGTSAEDLIRSCPLTDGANSLAKNLKEVLKNKLGDLKHGLSKNALTCNSCQTDLVRLSEGHVAVQVFSLTTNCSAKYKDAVSQTLEQIDVIKRLIAGNSDKMALVLKSSDINTYFKGKKLGVILSIWGGHNIDARLAVLRMYYDLGIRIMSLASFDSEEEEGPVCLPPWVYKNNSSLTDFGVDVVHEMNRLGMMIDLTGCPKALMSSVIDVTDAQVIFSHSGSMSAHNNTLNVEDDILKDPKNMIGLVMVPFTPSQLNSDNTNISDVSHHLDLLKMQLNSTSKLGIGSNFDNMVKTTKGLEDVSKFVNLIKYLRENSKKQHIRWTDDMIKGLISNNFLNVFKNIEKVKKDKQKTDKPDENIIPEDAYENKTCYSDFSTRYNNSHTDPVTEAPTKSTTAATTAATTKATTKAPSHET